MDRQSLRDATVALHRYSEWCRFPRVVQTSAFANDNRTPMEFRDSIQATLCVFKKKSELFFGCTLDGWASDELYDSERGKNVFSLWFTVNLSRMCARHFYNFAYFLTGQLKPCKVSQAVLNNLSSNLCIVLPYTYPVLNVNHISKMWYWWTDTVIVAFKVVFVRGTEQLVVCQMQTFWLITLLCNLLRSTTLVTGIQGCFVDFSLVFLLTYLTKVLKKSIQESKYSVKIVRYVLA